MHEQHDRPEKPEFVKQFIISRSRDHIPGEWTYLDRGGWRIAVHPSNGLPVVDILGSCGSAVGWLVGFGVDLRNGLLTKHLQLTTRADAGELTTAFESRIYELGGRYLAVLLLEGAARVYLDSCGSLAAVYSPRFGVVSSSTGLLPEAGESTDTDLNATLGIPQNDAWYPFGLTPRADATRLLPNHYLDLERWTQVRHWPTVMPEPAVGEAASRPIVAEIADTAGSLVERLSEAAALSLSLTAGHDSRMLLACARPVLHRVEFFTEAHRDRAGRLDCQIARRIARRFQLKHRFIPWESASEEELATWLLRTGTCVAGRTWMAARTASRTRPDGFKLLGLGSETGRAFYWNAEDIERGAPTLEEIVVRLRLPSAPQILDGARWWLDSVPRSSFPTTMDLLYLENRVGCWAAPQLYGHVGSKSDVFGWSHRRIMEGYLKLPLEVRAGDHLSTLLIRDRWPELLEWPFNEFVGPAALLDRAIRRFRLFCRNHPRIGRFGCSY